MNSVASMLIGGLGALLLWAQSTSTSRSVLSPPLQGSVSSGDYTHMPMLLRKLEGKGTARSLVGSSTLGQVRCLHACRPVPLRMPVRLQLGTGRDCAHTCHACRLCPRSSTRQT